VHDAERVIGFGKESRALTANARRMRWLAARRVRRSAVGACIGLAGIVPSTAATHAPIQPGAILTRPDRAPLHGAVPYAFYRCTMSFVFRDAAGALYTGTTGESDCAQKPGGSAFDSDGRPIGRVVFRECAPGTGSLAVVQECGTNGTSFTLIRIDRERYADVDPSVLGWGGPTAVASSATAKPGDVVLFAGNAFVEGDAVRPRLGILLSIDAGHFTADTVATLGDSGGPVIDATNGAAIGIISDYGQSDAPPTTDDGPTVSAILAAAGRHGLHLELVTWPYATAFGSGTPASPAPSPSPSRRPAPAPSVLAAHRALPGTGTDDDATALAAMFVLAAAAFVVRVSRG
jgi:hypothetical protein